MLFLKRLASISATLLRCTVHSIKKLSKYTISHTFVQTRIHSHTKSYTCKFIKQLYTFIHIHIHPYTHTHSYTLIHIPGHSSIFFRHSYTHTYWYRLIHIHTLVHINIHTRSYRIIQIHTFIHTSLPFIQDTHS